MYNCYISELRNFRMLVEAHEEHLIRQLRTPLERDDLEQSLQRISEHEVLIKRGAVSCSVCKPTVSLTLVAVLHMSRCRRRPRS